MRVGLTLAGDRLNEDAARFAAQLGVTDVVIHLVNYSNAADPSAYTERGEVGPILGDVSDEALWSYERMKGAVDMLARHGIRVAALENLSPKFWSDILLDGPDRDAQMEGLKTLVRDAGRAGIPVIGYNFSIAGVWGWQRVPRGRAGAVTVQFRMDEIEHDRPIPDGMVWNMRYRPERPGAPAVSVSDEEIWDRLERFLAELVPVAEEAGVRLAAHPDDPPVERLRGAARLVNSPDKYDRLLSLAPSPANALEFCVGSIQEMQSGDVYEATRHFARQGALAYVHFRNVRGKVPDYIETFVDDGDVDMAEIVRILRDEKFEGVLVPDHVPDLASPSPWHAGNAYTIGYMRALILNADSLGPSWSAARDRQAPQRAGMQ
ncbi:D-mannonate dehydratase [Arsenicitalea aurantiaca]|uniref:mannonate dehydratase n=1 Tax=Arsenicitalea aurantiaca TaxID=1783274 RepID=A0A433X3F1_9HYPH|nr:mannonate dehydratase [Arsenicitalea aurantiaca]RUT28595.1 D-mannonate dehydratase [Arsenicitalea aurantiaca]